MIASHELNGDAAVLTGSLPCVVVYGPVARSTKSLSVSFPIQHLPSSRSMSVFAFAGGTNIS